MHEAVNLVSWREDSIKLLYHICGSPCHGSNFKGQGSENSKKYDNYKDGCPCGIDVKSTLKTLRGKYIEYNLISLEKGLDKMMEEFSKYIKVELMSSNIEKEEGVSGNQLKNEDVGDDIIEK